MKKIVILILFLCSQLIVAQSKVYTEEEVDVIPKYPGGAVAFMEFSKDNFKLENPDKVQPTTIQLEFIVEANGEVKDVRIAEPKGTATEKEALRIMKLSPKWLPATIKGKAVACKVIQWMYNPYGEKSTLIIAGEKIHVKVYGNVPEDNNIAVEEPASETFEEDNQIYNIAGIDVKPQFPGGMEEFYKFFNANFKIPDEEGLKGKIFASFIIEKDGSLSEIKILRDIGYGTGKETIRVLKLCPKWNPGKMEDGRVVRVLHALAFPINTELIMPVKN